MFFSSQMVSLSEIQADEETYRITTAKDADSLAASLKTIGLINSPILIQKETTYTIISGFRRIAAMSLLGWPSFMARILPENTSLLDCARIAITENTFQRSLNPMELSSALQILSSCVEDKTGIFKDAEELGLPSTPSHIQKLLPLCRLPLTVREGILAETIAIPTALMLAALDEQIAVWFARLFNEIKISLNKQREIITLSQEIALRDAQPILSVFEESPIKEVLNNPDIDRTQKATAVRNYLKHRRFPTIVQAKEAFGKIIKSLNLTPSTKLTPPEDFEGTAYSLHFTFSNISQLYSCKDIIDRIAVHPEVAALIDPRK